VKLNIYRQNDGTEESVFFSISPTMLAQNIPEPAVGLSTRLAKLLGLVTFKENHHLLLPLDLTAEFPQNRWS
jgi:hypothetical protein